MNAHDANISFHVAAAQPPLGANSSKAVSACGGVGVQLPVGANGSEAMPVCGHVGPQPPAPAHGAACALACGNGAVQLSASMGTATPAAQSASFERWLGGKALGVIAAALVLLGLGMLGVVFIPQLDDALKAALVFAFAASLTAAGAILAHRKLNAFTSALLVCGAGAFAIAILLARFHFAVIDDLAAFCLLAAWITLCFGLSSITRTLALPSATLAFLLAYGFGLLDVFAPNAPAALAFGALAVAQFALVVLVTVDARTRQGTLHADMLNAMVAVLLVCEVALAFLAAASSCRHADEVACILYAAVLLGLALLPVARRDTRFYLPLRINEIVMLHLLALRLSLGYCEMVPSALASVAFAVIAAVLVVRVRELPRAAAGSTVRRGSLLVLGALGFTWCLTGYLYGYTTLVQEPHAYSAVLMACALVSIVAGFRFQAAPLRVYGLVLTVLCALKMVTIDISGLDTISRVFAFVASGLMCFVASALYNYASRRLRA